MRWLRNISVVTALVYSGLSPAVEVDDKSRSTAKPINSICPVTGSAVDAKLSPVVVVVGKGEKAKRVVIGLGDAAAAEKIKANPQRYADAAKANKKAE